MSPEKCIVVAVRITFWEARGESRRFACCGRQQSGMRYGKHCGHHRGLRAEHAFKGVARELERANCLLIQSNCIRYLGRIAKSEQTRDGLLAVLADNSTDAGALFPAGRWGSEAQATHCREGEARHNDLWSERREGL